MCYLGGKQCIGLMPLSPHNIKRGIIEHIREYHHVTDTSQDCTWIGCVCALPGSRCANRAPGHVAHVRDLAEHILNSHLGLRYACDLCGQAQWSSPFALSRHRSLCKGRVRVRCPGCLNEFDGEVALERHVEDAGCTYSARG
jgi:hypothetical protein